MVYLWNMFCSPFHSQCTLPCQGLAPVLRHRDPAYISNNNECFLYIKTRLRVTFTYVAVCRLADPVLEFVAFLTFGTYVAIGAEFTVGYAGQTGVVTPVRIETPRAVCPTATLVEETLLSVFICGGG